MHFKHPLEATHTRAHVSADAIHDLFRAVVQESLFSQLDNLDRRGVFVFRFFERVRDARADVLNSRLELAVLFADNQRFGRDFFVDVVWRDLNWANVVKFKLRYLVSLALLAGHGVGRSASMGKWRWLEAVRCVACAEDGIRRMLLKVAFVVEVEGIGGILIR